jgi:hypothetical protein
MTNKYKRFLVLTCVVLMAGLSMYYSNGPAQSGETLPGAPFVNSGQTCSNCHSGGNFNTTVSMQLLDQSNNVTTTYLPNQNYTLRITLNGINILTSTRYGFQAIAAFSGTNSNVNTWGTMPTNVHNYSSGGRNYIEHTQKLTSNVINIPWTGPTSSTAVVFYASGNIVNNNGGTNGDVVNSSSLTVNSGCLPITVGPGSLPNGTIGLAYSQTITQTGASGTPTFSVSSGSLPNGLSLNSNTGAITGTPTTSGTFTFDIQVQGSNGCVGTQSYSVTINCPTITLTPGTLPGGTVGTNYNQSVTQNGGTGTYTYSVTGTLPPGLSFNTTTGALTGTPTTVGNYNFTVTATGNGSCTGSQAYSISISCPTINVNPATIPTFVVGTPVNQNYTQTGGSGTITWSATGLPPGVTLNSSGQLTGTPTTTGTYNITITATGNGPCSGSQTFNNIVVGCPTISLSPANMPAMTVGTNFNQTVSQTGGSGTVTWAITAGTLPAGLNLNAGNGQISGIPTQQGPYCFTVTATGNGPCTGSLQYCGTVNCPTASVSPGTINNIVVGSNYSQVFSQTGLTGTITWSTSGNVPPGLSINSTSGQLSGTPNSNGSYTFTVTATSCNGCSASTTYTVTVGCGTFVITPGSLPNVAAGGTYNQTISQTGNFGTITYQVTSGSLPPGLNLNSTTGQITGTATTAGAYNFTVTISNQYGCSTTQNYSITVTCPTISLSPNTLPNAPIGQTYNQTITVTGSTNVFNFTVSAGSLPTGMTLSTAGVLSGTPTVAGTYTFTITATDNFGCTTSTQYTIVVACPTISLSPNTLPPGNVGFAYNQTITVTGSTNTFTFTSTGTLPTGLSLSNGGVLSGTPTTAGTYNFTVTATDGYGCTTNTPYSVTISPCSPLSLSATLPDIIVNNTYNQTVTQTGGTGTITWSTTGSLPTGLSINTTTGNISGTATQTGTFIFTVIATDGTGCTGTLTDTIVISCPSITLSPSTLAADTVGEAYSQTITQSGSTGSTFTYTLSSGSLPAGITLSSGGVISGTTTSTGTSTFDVTMTDEFGCSQTITYTITSGCPVIYADPDTVPTIYTNTPYSHTLSPIGGTGPYTYAVSSGTLPNGLTLSPGGVLSGTTADYGTYTITVTITDANGCTGTVTYNIVVDWPVTVKGLTAGKESIALIPNLVTDRTTALVVSNVSGRAQIRIMDITGKVVYNNIAEIRSGENRIELDLRDLAPGNYTFHIKPLNVKPVKFTKQ